MNLSNKSGWIQLDECRGYASNIQQAEEVRQTFEVSKRSTFVSYKTVLNFGKNDKIPEKYRIRFSDLGEEVVPYDGTPFIITGRKVNSCIFGKDKHVADKKKKQQDKASNLEKDHPIPVKEKVMVQTSKKKNCPASIIMKKVICFPDFKVTENTEKRKRVLSEKIRDLINGDDEIKMEYRIYIKFPTDQDHQNTHQLGELIGFMNPINKDVSAKIYELVGHGVSSVSEMRRHLKVFVNETLFSGKTLPSINDVAYYPTDTIIRKHMYMAQTKLKYSKIDQENMLQLVAEWQQQNPADNFDFMPAAEIHSDENGICLENIEEIEQDDSDEVYTSEKSEASSAFFFCHQTQFQRHLLQRYGNSLCMLDATYRTTKYALPLFFLAVKTNVGFSVVAEFIVQNETQASIQQGLETIQRWMAEDTNVPNGWSWKPKFFMTDFCEREIYAIETTFPETFVFLCDFHREQSWTRWTTKISNGVSGAKDKVLAMLRRCAHATTLSEFDNAVLRLNQSFEWKSSKRLQDWINKTWMPEKERWSWAFRNGKGLLVNTNNGLERQNKIFKYKYLEEKKNYSMSGMVRVLVQEYLPGMMMSYIKDNATSMETVGRQYNADVPTFLKDRPSTFIRNCMDKMNLASVVDATDVEKLSSTSFKVKSQSGEISGYYKVHFSPPNCECHSWQWNLLPCKHMFAIMQHYQETTWETLSEDYRLSPFFNLDRAIASFAEMQGANQSTNDDDINVSTSNHDTLDNATFQDLARPKTFNSSLKSAAVACRELTCLIINCTHLCQNIDALDHLSNMLDEARAYISSNIYTDGNLALEIDTSSKKRKARQQQGSTQKKKPKSLKISKTTSKTKRVGIAAEKRKQPIRVQHQNQNEYNPTIVIDGHASLPSEDSTSIQPPSAERTLDASHSLEHAEFRDPIFAMVGEVETVINASHSPKHVEFRDPICTVMGEEDIVIRNNTRSVITLNIEGYQINQNSLDDLDSELPDEVMNAFLSIKTKEIKDRNVGFLTTANITSIFRDLIDPLDPFPTHNYLDKVKIEDYDILLGALCENNNHWCLMVIYPQSRELLYLNPLGEDRTQQDQYLQNWLLFISERHNRGIRRNPSFSLEWSIVTRKHRKQLDSSSCGVFTLKFAEHVLTDNDFMFDSSKRAIRASRHIIGQVLFDNSGLSQQQQPMAVPTRSHQQQPKAMPPRTQQQQPKALPTRTQELQPKVMPPRTQQQQPKAMSTRSQQQKLKAIPIRTQQQQLPDMPPRTQQQQPKDMPQSTQQQQPKDMPPIKQQQQPNDMPPRSQQQPNALPTRPKLRKPKLKEKGIETASSSCSQDIHWLFISVSAKTCLQCQSLTSAMCDDFDTMPMTITRGFSSVIGHNLATLFDVHVKHKLKEVIEMTELQGSASYYSAHWRHIRWITGISLGKHMDMRKATAGICERQNIFGNTAGKELYALVLAEFSEWKIKSIQRLGFTHRHYLTVKDSINNSKLQETLDKMMSQNMNSGTRYFKDVLFVEAEILVVSHIKKITIPEADRLLHPLPGLKC